ncbi:unnamed protein product [Gordionus sp. m RMFG-2023]
MTLDNNSNNSSHIISEPTYSCLNDHYESTTDESSRDSFLAKNDFNTENDNDSIIKSQELLNCHTVESTPNNIKPIHTKVSNIISNSNSCVNLQPFLHQVGGHLCMLKFDSETICKPLQGKERDFYKYLVPPILKHFVAKYYGLVEVSLEIDKEGYINLVAPKIHYLKPFTSNNINNEDNIEQNIAVKRHKNGIKNFDRWSSIKVKMRCSGSMEVLDPLELNLFEKADLTNPSKNNDNISSNKRKPYSFNPWSLKRHKEQILSMQKENQITYKFIRLQDLTCQYSYPCVLDLKMGTRQYGDDASEQKKISQIAKCESSTSSSLGVRICGMQVYQPQTETFFCYDKYIGRKLSVEGFEESLKLFFQTALTIRDNTFTNPDKNNNNLIPLGINDHQHTIDILGSVLRQLILLRDAIASLNSYRFYSSSLLILYEGDPCLTNGKFHSQADMNNNFTLNGNSNHIEHHPSTKYARINMVDFAHSSSCHKDGRDKGYLFGLDNLIKIIKRIQ